MQKQVQAVLAIETSCDETAAAVVAREDRYARVLSSAVSSQIGFHRRTMGVVPEVAARAHVEALPSVIDEAMKTVPDTDKIDAVAVTERPGLEPALATGRTAARAIASAWAKPLISINHLAGHIASAWIVSDIQDRIPHTLPSVALLVSGGHTELYRVEDDMRAFWLGGTRDDAAGEAFDKIARMIGLSYPGGPALSLLAEKGDSAVYDFPRPMAHSRDLDMSFSGLKTAVKNHVGNRKLPEQERADIAASAQEAICDILAKKTAAAVERERVAEVILTGGVAANTRLRERLAEVLAGVPLRVPHPQYCTDNAGMIGAAALLNVRIVE